MSKEIEVIYVTEDDIESCGLWQEDTGTPFIRKSDYDSLHNDWVKISDNQNDEITRLREKVGALTVQLTEAERLNKVALEAMKKVAVQIGKEMK